MTPLHELIASPLLARLGWVLVHFVWEGFGIALALSLVLLALRRAAPNVRYVVSCGAMAALAIVPVITFALIPQPQPVKPPHPADEPAIVPAPSVEAPSGLRLGAVATPPAEEATTRIHVPSVQTTSGSIGLQNLTDRISPALPWLVLGWLAGVMLVSVWNLGGWVTVHQLRSRTTRPAGAAAHDAARRIARRFGLSRPVRILQSGLVESPLVIGAIKPVILLPVSVLTEMPAAQLESLLAHELAHVLRHDYLVNLLQSVVETLLFYHPAVWWVSRRIRIERELCCDDLVVNLTKDRASYARALAALASVRAPMLAAAASGGKLLPRLRRVLGLPDADAGRPGRWVAAAVVLALCAVGAVLAANHDASEANKKDDVVHVHGQVLDPQGHAVAGAKVVAAIRSMDAPLAESRSRADGKFEISFPRSRWLAANDEWENRWEKTVIVASSEGFGPAWARWDQTDAAGDVSLKLVPDDIPIEGRLLDLEGRPITGARVWVDDLSGHAVDLKSMNIDRSPGDGWAAVDGPPDDIPGWAIPASKPVQTGADGRFRIGGLGRDRTANLRITGPGIVRSTVQVLTRPGQRVTRTFQNYIATTETTYGAAFDYTPAPARVVSGTVRDAKTGQPMAGVLVKRNNGGVRAEPNLGDVVTDANGSYRIDGIPKGRNTQLLFVPNDEQPYFMSEVDVPDTAGLAPITIDVSLHRGIWISGKVTDHVTGKPVGGTRINYLPYLTNKYAFATPEFQHASGNRRIPGPETRYHSKADGTYRLVGLPGPALVTAWCTVHSYCNGVGGDKIKCPVKPGTEIFQTYDPLAARGHPNALKEVDIPDGAQDTHVNFELDPGITITVSVVDPQGKPMEAFTAIGQIPSMGFERIHGSTVDAVAFRPDGERRMFIWDAARKIGKAIVLRPADVPTRKLTVRLEPWSYITGRLIGPDGQPIAKARVAVAFDQPATGTDDQGRFRLAVLSGVEYGFDSIKGREEMLSDVGQFTVAPGQVKDLGDVHVRIP